jgi:sialate O-acetylesterase
MVCFYILLKRMKLIYKIKLAAFCCLIYAAGLNATAQVRLPQLVSSGMVLQRDIPLTIWGWAGAGEKISLTFKGKKYHTTSDAKGSWNLILTPMHAGGPYKMELNASNHIVLEDILIGDVWFCSGQSNMVVNMERVKEKFPEEVQNANYPQIRNFFVQTAANTSGVERDLPAGKWMAASPQQVLQFGAASYFFAKKIYDKYKVPIGIINSSVGGTPIQAWISESGLAGLPKYTSRLAQLKDTAYLNPILRQVEHQKLAASRKAPVLDKGLTGAKSWYDESYQPLGWHRYWMPGYWADQGIKGLNGVVWFRKEIDLPQSIAGETAKLMLGRLVDADETYVNGQQVGRTTYKYPPRRYEIPKGLLRPGKNLIVVRLTNTSGKGGFVPDKPYYLLAGDKKIDLRGDWQYQVGQVFSAEEAPAQPLFVAQNELASLYNAMVAPAVNYGIKGVLWYQGETNAESPGDYGTLLQALIYDWRRKFKVSGLPFIYAQLPNFNEVEYTPGESNWAIIREAELKALVVPNTAMAVTIDAGEWNDIHPLDKKTVGNRLALAAEGLAYNNPKVVSMGPILESSRIEGTNIMLSFKHTGTGLLVKGGGELTQFAIAGQDKKFVWAKAAINGNSVVVSSPEVPKPRFVRYAWADNPEGANLYNKEGLPASPFRTDN